MKLRVFLVLASVLIAGPAFAQKIYIDYDKDYDGSKNKTFAWSEAEEATLAQIDPMPRNVSMFRHPLRLGKGPFTSSSTAPVCVSIAAMFPAPVHRSGARGESCTS